jgi:thioredoxin reductase
VRGRAGLATGGVAYRRLDAAGVDELLGSGVRYGSAPGEATTCRDAGVIVVGGANSAAQAAPHLAEYAERVTMIVRADSLARRASQYLVTRIEAHDRIDARTSARLIRADGETHLEAVQISVPGGEETIAADAMFVIIGGEPLTSGLEEELRLDEAGYIMTGPDIVSDDRERWWPLERQPLFLESSQPGLFVAGDIRHGSTKRVASAVGEGAMAIALVHAHLARLERERQHPEGSRVDPQTAQFIASSADRHDAYLSSADYAAMTVDGSAAARSGTSLSDQMKSPVVPTVVMTPAVDVQGPAKAARPCCAAALSLRILTC